MREAWEGLKLTWAEFPIGMTFAMLALVGTVVWGVVGVVVLGSIPAAR